MRTQASGTSGGRRLSTLLWFYAFGFLFLSAGVGPAAAAGPEILGIRYFTGPSHTRVVLDLSGPASFEVREVRSPERVAVNVRSGRFRETLSVAVGDGLIRGIRRNQGGSRAQVVLDLVGRADIKSFSLPAADGRHDRIVVDVFPRSGSAGKQAVAARPVGRPEVKDTPFTVVIDPGHGGLDPGAIRKGVREKDVVLEVARETARLINQLPGYRAILTRKTDYYPSLGRRVEIAREVEGDLFLSVHCNTNRKTALKGMEVYFLSLQGATNREARELADKENAADLVGLDPEQRHDDTVMKILMDLRMSQILHESGRLAENLLAAADGSGIIRGRKAAQARFQVLRSLAMPSALVEIAYLSNSDDRKLLNSRQGRARIASILAEGILSWRRDAAAVAGLVGERPASWTRNYRVRRGDSLWKLAKRHGTTVTEISRKNNLRSQAIMVGQLLRLPEVYNAP